MNRLHSITFILIVIALRLTRFQRQRFCFSLTVCCFHQNKQLGAEGHRDGYTHHDIFHVVDEFGIFFWWNRIPWARFNFVLVSVWRFHGRCFQLFLVPLGAGLKAVMSTGLPSGDWLQAIAIRCASCSPSRRLTLYFGRLSAEGGFYSLFNKSPHSIVGMLISKALLISKSFQPILNNSVSFQEIRAWLTL